MDNVWLVYGIGVAVAATLDFVARAIFVAFIHRRWKMVLMVWLTLPASLRVGLMWPLYAFALVCCVAVGKPRNFLLVWFLTVPLFISTTPPWCVAEYDEGIRFFGSPQGAGGPFDRVEWDRTAPWAVLPLTIEAGSRLTPTDFEYAAFKGIIGEAQADVAVEANGFTERTEDAPVETLEFAAPGFTVICRYDYGRTLKHLEASVDYRTLLKGTSAFSVMMDGKTVQLPCSFRTLTRSFGKPRQFKKYSM